MRWGRAGLGVILLWGGCSIKLRPAGSVPAAVEGSPCTSSEECPYPETGCLLSQCLDGECVFIPAPEGPLPLEEQKAGDCKQLYCDGNGRVTAYPAPVDGPAEDDNPCTVAGCDLTNPKQKAQPAGTRCGEEGVCNGLGSCGVCMPGEARCEGSATAVCSKQGQWASTSCSPDKPVCSHAKGSSARCVGVMELAGGAAHGCARFEDGSVRCWGADHKGQLGTAGFSSAQAPSWAGRYAELAFGGAHACGRDADGAVECWGSGTRGQLGGGTWQDASDPTPATITEVTGIAVGALHSCARTSKGEAHCWGDNRHGQLGSGKLAQRQPPLPDHPSRGDPVTPPVAIEGLIGARALSLGLDHSCAQAASGLVCWGAFEVEPGDDGGGDDGSASSDAGKVDGASATPTWVPGIKDVAQVACGRAHSCARTEAGAVFCWGAGERGQLGSGTKDSLKPVAVKGVEGARHIQLGADFGCAMLADGRVTCWGANSHGQLGRGSNGSMGEATAVDGLSGVTKLTVGERFVCAMAAAAVRCWGADAGGGVNKPTPVVW